MNKILLVDGHSIMHRAYYGLGPNARFSAADNTPTGAVFTFLNICARYMNLLSPTHLCVAFDRSEPTFRHRRFEAYKAQRKPMPEELSAQFPVVKEILDGMNVARIELAGYEADDLLGTLSKQYEKEGFEVYILSGDKDSFQLVSDRVTVVMPEGRQAGGTAKLYDVEAVFERYQVTPRELIEVKAIMGDPSDNIPGVKGIGEKGAIQLISKYKSLENIYANLDELKPAQKKKMEESKENALLSRELSTIVLDAPVERSADFAKLPDDLNDTRAYEVLAKYSLNSIIRKFDLRPTSLEGADESSGERVPGFEPKPISANSLIHLLKEEGQADSKPLVFLDVERTPEDEPARMSLGLEDGRAFVLDTPQEIADVFAVLCELNLELVGYDLKNWFRMFDGRLRNPPFDVCSAAYVLNQLQGANTTLSMLYNQEMGELTDLAGPAETLRALRELSERQRQLIGERGLNKLAYEMDMPLAVVVGRMEHAGFPVDHVVLDELAIQFAEDISSLEEEIFALSGHEFNINSPKQLGVILYEELGLPTGRKSATKQFSTDNDEMERLRPFHPIIGKIVEYRQLTKLKSTFVDALNGYIKEDGRIHCSFNQNLTTTGRLSSSDPNLQNIPIRLERGREIRKAFVASEGHILIDADYSQIELRLLAHLSGDQNMIAAFRDRKDIHKATASGLFGVDLADVTSEMRAAAKTVNFSIIYGISDFGLAKDLGIAVKDAKQYIAGYYDKYPEVRVYLDELIELAKQQGYIDTLYGRRRPIPELKSKNYSVRMFGERAAMNSPVQGTAADIMRLAMIQVDRELAAAGLRARIISQVHDELILEVPEEEVEQAGEILRACMGGAARLSVPLEVSLSMGPNWFDVR